MQPGGSSGKLKNHIVWRLAYLLSAQCCTGNITHLIYSAKISVQAGC